MAQSITFCSISISLARELLQVVEVEEKKRDCADHEN